MLRTWSEVGYPITLGFDKRTSAQGLQRNGTDSFKLLRFVLLLAGGVLFLGADADILDACHVIHFLSTGK